MQRIQYFPAKGTYVYQNGRHKEAREATPIMAAAYAAARKYPHMTSRVWKAGSIFEDGQVTLLPPKEQLMSYQFDLFTAIDVATVCSQPENKGYTVRRLYWKQDLAAGMPAVNHDHKFSCECYDYTEGNAPIIKGQPQCKHILATKIALNKRDKAQAEPLQPIAMTEDKASQQQKAEDDPETHAIMVAAREKAAKRRKGVLYERINDQITRRQWELQQSQP